MTGVSPAACLIKGLAFSVPSLVVPHVAETRAATLDSPIRVYAEPRALFIGLNSLLSLSLAPDQTYSGTVPLAAQFDLSSGVPSAVAIAIGGTTRPMIRVGSTDVWRADSWDTMRKLANPSATSPNNFLVWAQVKATYGTRVDSTSLFPVYTGNYRYGDLPDRGWDPALAWSADYSSMTAWLGSLTAGIPGKSYASLVNDPVRGASRKAIKVTLPDSARFESDQPTSSPRFQAQQPTALPWRGISEGHAFYTGFAVYVPPRQLEREWLGRFPDCSLSDAQTRESSILRSSRCTGRRPISPTTIPLVVGRSRSSTRTGACLHRSVRTGSTSRRISSTAATPAFVVDFPYNRGAWTDIVMGLKMSADIRRGWIEIYLNQGGSSTVQPVKLFGGKTRLPRVTAWPTTSTPAVPATFDGTLVQGGSYSHRTDMQIYRSPTAYEEVTLLHTAHRVGSTVASVDPRSYA